jgi:hypothetical protein
MFLRTAPDLADALRNLSLLPPEQLDEMARLQGQFPNAKDLARELLQRGVLTAYQANQLLQG